MARRTILTVIVLAMLTVVFALFIQPFIQPERLTKNGLEEIVADYYENDFYPSILEANVSNKPISEILEHYSKVGFTEVTLRQLLILKGDSHQKAAANLKNYCDENKTIVQIFPDEPYSNKDYHVEYGYSCNFK